MDPVAVYQICIELLALAAPIAGLVYFQVRLRAIIARYGTLDLWMYYSIVIGGGLHLTVFLISIFLWYVLVPS